MAKNVKLTFYLQPALHKRLMALRRRLNMKLTPLMQLVVAEFVDNHRNDVEKGIKLLQAEAEFQRQLDENDKIDTLEMVRKLQESIREASKKRKR